MIRRGRRNPGWTTRGEYQGLKTIEKSNGRVAGISVASGLDQRLEVTSDRLFDNFIWLSTSEAAEYLRTSPKQLRKWVYQGKVKAHKLLSKSLRFKKSDLDRLFEGGRAWE